MQVWVITFFSTNSIRCLDGVYASLDKARLMVNRYIDMYDESYVDYIEQPNGVHSIITDKGRYDIEGIAIDGF